MGRGTWHSSSPRSPLTKLATPTAPASSACTMASILLLLLLFSVDSWPGRSHGFSIMNYLCNNGSSYALNSTYHSNVVALLGSLSANASSSAVGFATGTVGAASDQTWGLALCRGDINGTSCASCLTLVPGVGFGDDCRGVKDVTVYCDSCLLRYSDKDFLASPGDPTAVAMYSPSLAVNVTVDPGRYVELAADLVGALSAWAAQNSTARYAAGLVTSAQGFTTTEYELVHSIYGLVQCAPDLAPEACQGCLGGLKDTMPDVFNGTAGGQVNGVWCNLRYERFLFYDSSPVVKLVAPPPPPPPGAAVPNDGDEEDDGPRSLLFDLVTLRRATANFAQENKLGHGGFGAVYKGLLPDGRQIAVKRLDKASGQGLKELRNELLLVAKLRHNNLAKLLGVCLKGQEKLLVYEYLPNRSLDTFLFVPEKRQLLDWETRYRILYGTARGLLYLHEDSQIRIIHRDLKASNILLDAEMNPKISDFGLARLFIGDKTTTITSQVVGTLGYMAPEYAVLGHLSVKLDVYSFGVLILEIITGRRNTDMFESAAAAAGEPTILLSYVWDHWLKGTALEAVDPSLDCQAPESEVMLKCIHLGLLCVQENPADRPTMLDVLVMLHGQSSGFPAPSKPAFAFAFGETGSSGSGEQGNNVVSAGGAAFSLSGVSVSEFQPR
ncbi:hypothetical protein BS78_01G130700 [Paspalum vaginatum]|nr:hypothetical protein BS78_01G130700 [Paspalum vaginatum]